MHFATICTRRSLVAIAAAAVGPNSSPISVAAANDAAALSNPLWPRDGLFPDCPASDTCVSSQDDRPQSWDNPWVFEDDVDASFKQLRRYVEGKLNGKVTATDGERYLKAEFEDRGPLGTAVDDAEFFFAPDDSLVQFRSARRGDAQLDFGANRRRLEKARIALGWEKVPVLRNRRRALVVAESPFDSFGPALYTDSYQDSDPAAVPFKPPTKFERAWMRESDDRVRSR